eukprot:scaffold39944_cov15-Tisochrysis_lutea.AAC.2
MRCRPIRETQGIEDEGTHLQLRTREYAGIQGQGGASDNKRKGSAHSYSRTREPISCQSEDPRRDKHSQ